MNRIQVLPRDLKPGDKIERLNREIELVPATIKSVVKVRTSLGSTVYKVYLVEESMLPSRPSSRNRHLRPFYLQPTNRVYVDREGD